jgi:predicted Zn-dependent protease
LALISTSGCTTVPETGRSQFNLFSLNQEAELGARAYSEILAQEKLSTDRKANEMLQRVGTRIATVSSQPDWAWEFKLIESEQANAFCLPGGKVAVYTGILPYTRNEAGLAAVVGHEVAHAIARHGGERMSQQTLIQGGAIAVDAIVGGQAEEVRDIVNTAYGLGSTTLVILPYSRDHESEADTIGTLYMARAGYDPHEAIELWKRMPAGGGLEWLSTHPSNETRIRNLEELMPRAFDEYRRSKFRQ